MSQKGLGTNDGGGVVSPKPVMNYSPPKATKPADKPRVHDLKATNHGNCGTQGKR